MAKPTEPGTEIIILTANIVSAYVGSNPLTAVELPSLIISIHSSLSGIGQPAAPMQPALAPVVDAKRSVFPDYIICLKDGRKFKPLKRHLGVHYGLTPDAYHGALHTPAGFKSTDLWTPLACASKVDVCATSPAGSKREIRVDPRRLKVDPRRLKEEAL